ncbi:MAG: Flp family type IVb pilin, partial [Chloroflexi bacterium]|nr:Flp family type IVb pilin [Chloroflexota bacterium]
RSSPRLMTRALSSIESYKLSASNALGRVPRPIGSGLACLERRFGQRGLLTAGSDSRRQNMMWRKIMRRFFNRVRAFVADESGVTASEYAVIITLVIVGLIVGIALIGDKVTNMFVNVEQQWQSV